MADINIVQAHSLAPEGRNEQPDRASREARRQRCQIAKTASRKIMVHTTAGKGMLD